MAECTFEVFDAAGGQLARHDLPSVGDPDPALLARLYREHLHRSACRHAVLREGRRARALYLSDDAVPAAAVRFGGQRGVKGGWITRALRLGEWGGGRVFLGPGLFFRQVDVAPPEAWLALQLMRFEVESGAAALPFRDRELFEVRLQDALFFYANKGTRWTLYGAGNTPRERLEQALDQERPESSDAFLWTVGAVRLP